MIVRSIRVDCRLVEKSIFGLENGTSIADLTRHQFVVMRLSFVFSPLTNSIQKRKYTRTRYPLRILHVEYRFDILENVVIDCT